MDILNSVHFYNTPVQRVDNSRNTIYFILYRTLDVVFSRFWGFSFITEVEAQRSYACALSLSCNSIFTAASGYCERKIPKFRKDDI